MGRGLRPGRCRVRLRLIRRTKSRALATLQRGGAPARAGDNVLTLTSKTYSRLASHSFCVFVAMPRRGAASIVSFKSSRTTNSVTPSTSASNVSRRSRRRGPVSQVTSAMSRVSLGRKSAGSKSARSAASGPLGRSIVRKPVVSQSLSVSPLVAHSYWDASRTSIPPSLPTTYGNFTCVNSVARFALSTVANVPFQMQVHWSPSALRTTYCYGALTATSVRMVGQQQQQLNATNTTPLDIRPLRMTLKLKCTTQNLNIASNVVAVLVPQSVTLAYGLTGGANMPYLTAASWSSLWQLAAGNPKAVTITNADLARKGSTFVMPPSSFTAYNQYQDWVPLSSGNDGSTVTDADWLALNGLAADPASYPASLNQTWFGATPTNYMLLINFEPNPLAQTFEVECFCQDGVRFPANSLAASMEHRPSASTLTMEALSQLASSASSSFSSSLPSVSGRGDRGGTM